MALATRTITAQIRCINKSERYNPHERIKAIGGINSDGNRWRLSQDEAIEGIEIGKYNFFVSINGRRVDVAIATSRYGNKYLKTRADQGTENNLLSLPECPN